jgi:hypothetical protein
MFPSFTEFIFSSQRKIGCKTKVKMFYWFMKEKLKNWELRILLFCDFYTKISQFFKMSVNRRLRILKISPFLFFLYRFCFLKWDESYQDQVSEIVALKDHYKFKPFFLSPFVFLVFRWIKKRSANFFFCHLRTKGFRRLYRLEMSQFFSVTILFHTIFRETIGTLFEETKHRICILQKAQL